MRSLHSFLAGTAVLSLAALVSQPAFGQEIDLSQGEDEGEVIIVTGSRIGRPNLDTPVPVTIINGEDLFQQAQTNIGDTLNQLPQFRSTYAQQNPGLGIGIAGLNLLDLRGLGTQRTLVLVNGRRHVAGDLNEYAVSTDVNTIPNDLIERVDVVTGANSAVYGSDAIAGVVNFILKKDYEGLQVRGSAGISQGGFGENQYISTLGGTNFADGRGNITIHAEFANQERVFASEIAGLRRADGLGTVDIDPPGLANGSDGMPDRVLIRDLRSASINRFGLVPVVQPDGGLCGTGISNGVIPGSPYNCSYLFTPEGEMVPQTGTRYGSGIIGGIIGGNGQTGREGRLLSVLPEMQRYNTNLLAHYEFSEAADAFVEAKYVRVNARGSNAGASFIQGQRVQFDERERIRLDNPFLRPEDRLTLANAILSSGYDTSFSARNELTSDQIAGIADGSYRFVLGRNLLDVGIRDEDFQRDTYRIVGGLRGTFNDDWQYEVSANYGKMKEKTSTYGFLDRQRFMLALDGGVDPVSGQIVCRAQFDPAAAVPYPNTPENVARLAADVAACVPYNPFGAADNSKSVNYFSYNARHTGSIDQLVFNGFVTGDSSQVFELPGGPIRFALGAEYRRENAFFQQDPFVESGATNAVVIPTFEPPSFVVKEAFGELQLPILSDKPFFHDLSLNGAARVADYKGLVGTVWAYNAGAEWAPVRDIRFRGGYGRAVRAPNVAESGSPVTANFAPGFLDPCNVNNIGSGSQYRATNCEADLGSLLANIPTGSYSLPILSGSNPNLKPETSDSWTFGAVIQPGFVPGLSLTVDYYDIAVNGVITSLTAQQIVNGCYDQPTMDNPLCAVFQRYRGTGAGPFGEVAGQVLGNSLNSAPFNFARRVRRGIDFDLTYVTSFTDDARLKTRFLYSHQLKSSNFQNPTDSKFENRLLGELGDPQDEFRWNVDVSSGPFTLGYQMSYIGPMWVNYFEDFNSLQGRPPQDADYADIQKYQAVFYHDIRVDIEVAKGVGGGDLKYYLGVDNFLNTRPPLGSTATGAGSAIYDFRGRTFYTGFKATF
ncbi:TonB-dependent receptor [Croceibacterium sp. LX-88]|uniref:TonB-dependent receptor n=1 Tax=Croceibacterium selenioxidans TaxID=2838833 RepID=A0ABS5VZS9_9SPHN|nr:TonB-dependent receptor [Croceibacterium selenioxidans]MBT2133030.1 TonB-dependent receptor [Croceibacterium selenioxidans]